MSLWDADQFGPFHYDTEGTGNLWVELPLRDAVVVEKLRGTRQLGEKEIEAVQELYFALRATLALFAFIFDNFSAVVDRLIREPSERQGLNSSRSSLLVPSSLAALPVDGIWPSLSTGVVLALLPTFLS